MSLPTPTTQEVADNIIAQLETTLAQTIPLLPKSFTRVLAKSLAGLIVLLYKYAGFMFLQMFVAHATIDETVVNGKTIRPLVEWGRLFGVGDPVDATNAELDITVDVQNQTGSLAAGAQLLRADTGVLYLSTAAVLLDAAQITVPVRAASGQDGASGAGAIGNLEPGDVVTFVNPLPNVARDAVVDVVTLLGADGETTEAYRARVLDRTQARPQGGAYADYRVWGGSVAGVANIFPYTGDPGEVDVYVAATVTVLNPDGIPDGALLTAVADAIELDVGGLANNRPANAAVNTLAITRAEFDVTVTSLTGSNLGPLKASITDGLDEYLRRREPFIVGLSVLPRGDRITQGSISGVVNDIVGADGATVGLVTLNQGPASITAYTLAAGETAKLGTVSFV